MDLEKLKIRDRSLEDQVRTALVSKADVMFQWVRCKFDVLCTCISNRKINECLQSVPVGLDETYTKVLARICGYYLPIF